MISGLRVFMRHVRAVPPKGICAPGVRGFFRRNPHLNIADLNKEGIPAKDLLDTGDIFAARCVTVAQEEANRGRR